MLELRSDRESVVYMCVADEAVRARTRNAAPNIVRYTSAKPTWQRTFIVHGQCCAAALGQGVCGYERNADAVEMRSQPCLLRNWRGICSMNGRLEMVLSLPRHL